ncbi:MAG: trypsin-like peptidase domain-containing protein [Ardenticatenaceae bacterium]|nr:trypsin-like peptidase domain-containing protein [Ardenticatenaceae bacterium]
MFRDKFSAFLMGAVLFLLLGVIAGAAFLPVLNGLGFNTGVQSAETLLATEEAALTESRTGLSAPLEQTSQQSETVLEESIEEAVGVEIQDEPIVESAPPAPELSAAQATFQLEETLIALYDTVNPSVVFIFTYIDDFGAATGTGFVYDGEGNIITNNHVVADADRYEVLFPTGERVAASLVGTDVDSDLAVIKVDVLPSGINPIPLGNSTDIEIGQFAVAIGNPFGQQSSMSLGIISGLGRSLPSQRIADGGGRYSLPQVIQTDAPINPGNSGGPLLNIQGEVIGVNAAIRSETGSNTGVGFSIPVNIVRRVVPALIAEGNYVYPFLGVQIAPPIDLATQRLLDLPQPNGAYVTGITPGGPADDGGLVASSPETQLGGDLIIGVDGLTVNSFEDLISYLVFETEVGQDVTLTVLRDGSQVDVNITLGARP